MKYFFALDTSFEQGSLGLFGIEKNTLHTLCLKEWQSCFKKKGQTKDSHSDRLPEEFSKILSETKLNFSDINFLSVTQGPGRFTGVRLAVNVIKTLAFALKIPCYPVDSLFVTAQSLKNNTKNLAVAFNAFKNSVYFSEFSKDNKILQASCVLSFPEFLKRLEKIELCLGDIERFYEIPSSIKQTCKFQTAQPQAKVLAEITHKFFIQENLQPWFKLQPVYLRANL